MASTKRSKMFSLVAVLFVLSFFTITETPLAFACDCMRPGTPNEELGEATAVFSGTVTDIDRDLAGYKYKIRFDVEKTWKGISDKTIVVSTGTGGGDCGYHFKENEKYFVYAYGDISSLSADTCSRTGLLSAAGEDLSDLGEGKAPLSEPKRPSGVRLDFSNNLVFIITLAVAVLVLIIYKVISSRKKVS